MKNRWTLHVEDFGSIRSADIEVAPMMLFVGENNTGKSYLASLLWGISEFENLIFPLTTPTEKSYKLCEKLIVEHFQNKNKLLGQDLIDAIIEWVNELLDKKKDKLIQKIFSYKDLKIRKLSIHSFRRSQPLLLEWDEIPNPIIDESISDIIFDSVQPNLIRIRYIFDGFDTSYPDLDADMFYRMVRYLTLNLITDIIEFSSQLIDLVRLRLRSFYLPASRTGFMLSYKSLAAELFNLFGIDKKEIPTTFTMPIIHFLQRLIKSEISPTSPFTDIAESLEKQILKGKIVQNSQTQRFYYAPESNPTNLMPLHTTSSIVTELAPLIIFLKERLSAQFFKLLVFEEPESHLHLSAQRILAKHLVKLVNRGLPVWITTHSDTFFQQINNLTASGKGRIEKLKNMSYQDDEIIKPEDIKAYQFNIAEDGKTDIVSLKLTDDGFPASNFNHTLWNLSKESMSLEAD